MVSTTAAELVSLAQALGQHPARLLVGTEGSCAGRVDADRIVVSAAGRSLADLTDDGVVELKFPETLALLDSDAAVDDLLAEQQSAEPMVKPSIDATAHAYLLSLEGVGCTARTQPIEVNQILCSPRARQFADRRSTPQEIFSFSAASVLVPYTQPGLALAREIKRKILLWRDRFKVVPKLVLIQNHGMFALGRDREEALSITEAALKSAQIFVGASLLGGPAFLTPSQVAQIEPLQDV
jgi:rhamnose utilization protein RhaD (predicted bifunctional aldolase and dehydrogenase)